MNADEAEPVNDLVHWVFTGIYLRLSAAGIA